MMGWIINTWRCKFICNFNEHFWKCLLSHLSDMAGEVYNKKYVLSEKYVLFKCAPEKYVLFRGVFLLRKYAHRNPRVVVDPLLCISTPAHIYAPTELKTQLH